MNNFSNWRAKLMALVETYVSARMQPGGSVVGANLATVAALADIEQHAEDHPAAAPIAPTPNRVGGAGEE